MISLIMIMIMIILIMIRDSGDDDNYHLDLYIIGRFCLFVTKNDHFAQRSQIKFFSGSNFFF